MTLRRGICFQMKKSLSYKNNILEGLIIFFFIISCENLRAVTHIDEGVLSTIRNSGQ